MARGIPGCEGKTARWSLLRRWKIKASSLLLFLLIPCLTSCKAIDCRSRPSLYSEVQSPCNTSLVRALKTVVDTCLCSFDDIAYEESAAQQYVQATEATRKKLRRAGRFRFSLGITEGVDDALPAHCRSKHVLTVRTV